jgi:hypothetical protein
LQVLSRFEPHLTHSNQVPSYFEPLYSYFSGGISRVFRGYEQLIGDTMPDITLITENVEARQAVAAWQYLFRLEGLIESVDSASYPRFWSRLRHERGIVRAELMALGEIESPKTTESSSAS